MAVNRYKEHLTVFLEDEPYRELVNGAKLLLHVNDTVLNIKAPCRGWAKVFAELEDNLGLLSNTPRMHVLLLMDFDNNYQDRKQRFNQILETQECKNRVFILGIDSKESEDLKATLKQSNNEEVGRFLLQNCPDELVSAWSNKHLACNQEEIERMREVGVFEWLFDTSKI